MRDDIHIIVDSVACSNETELLNNPRVHVMRLIVQHGNQEWFDGDKTVQEMFDLVDRTGQLPKTSQPPVGYMVDLFTELAKAGKKLIVITLCAALSGTYQTSCMAAKQVMHEVKGSDIRVIDSNTCAAPISGLAMDLLQLADEGKSLDELEKIGNDMVARTETIFSVNTLEYLRKGGRIGTIGALLGGFLGIRPVVIIAHDGSLKLVDKCRTRKKVLKRMIEIGDDFGPLDRIYVSNANTPEDAAMLVQEMSKLYPDVPIMATSIGTVLAAHVGPGVIGLFVRRKA